MLVTLLVLWMVVVPLATVVGMYVLASFFSRRNRHRAPDVSRIDVLGSPRLTAARTGGVHRLAIVAGGSRQRDHRLTR